MAVESKGAPGLNYTAFKRRLDLEGFSGKQCGPLKLRLDLLESFMELPTTPGITSAAPAAPNFPEPAMGTKDWTKWHRKQKNQRLAGSASSVKDDIWAFAPGSLTIVDLSCPFVDDGAACALFDICLALFLENRGDVGRIVALDEAHKVSDT